MNKHQEPRSKWKKQRKQVNKLKVRLRLLNQNPKVHKQRIKKQLWNPTLNFQRLKISLKRRKKRRH